MTLKRKGPPTVRTTDGHGHGLLLNLLNDISLTSGRDGAGGAAAMMNDDPGVHAEVGIWSGWLYSLEFIALVRLQECIAERGRRKDAELWSMVVSLLESVTRTEHATLGLPDEGTDEGASGRD